MRIQILHTTYQQRGGEDVVVASEGTLLRKHGHKVHLHSVSNDTIQGLWRKLVTAWQTPYSRWGRRETMRIIKKTAPGIVHVLNFFPLLSPSVYETCRDAEVPVVQTLHKTTAPSVPLALCCVMGSQVKTASKGRRIKLYSMVATVAQDWARWLSRG